jgi:flagellin
MSLVINHNMMAIVAARNLGAHYSSLATSTQRLSSGLRINSAADDAAGLAVSESMKASITGMAQGVRNAGDALSLLQTADGALSVVDEKLNRMKELAQQAATGTYTTSQRSIMDSEYQAMAAEIDRIANATDFNGVKLLNGTLSALNGGSGMKIHFGTGNSSAEDYYYVKINDMRATTTTGLQVGGGATANVLATASGVGLSYASTLVAGGYFAFNYGVSGAMSANNLAGFYQIAAASGTLGTLASQINMGTAARIFGNITASLAASGVGASGTLLFTINGLEMVLTSTVANNTLTASYIGVSMFTGAITSGKSQSAIIAGINAAVNATFWAVSGNASGNIMFIAKNPGITGNNISAIESNSLFTFSGVNDATATAFSGGGTTWATAAVAADGSGKYGLTLTGADRGTNYDLSIVVPSDYVAGLTAVGSGHYDNSGATEWIETTANSGSGGWNGADILTQEDAQLALGQIDAAINTKDTQRAALGATSNRLNNTITNLQIQGENLQAAQSRIADVDVATEMTNFTKNSILTQAATAMLAQANALPRLALQLLGGGGGI